MLGVILVGGTMFSVVALAKKDAKFEQEVRSISISLPTSSKSCVPGDGASETIHSENPLLKLEGFVHRNQSCYVLQSVVLYKFPSLRRWYFINN